MTVDKGQIPNRELLAECVVKHLRVAGCKHNLFDEAAMTAIYLGSGGIRRRETFLCGGGVRARKRNKP